MSSATPSYQNYKLNPMELEFLIALQERPDDTFSNLAEKLKKSVQTISAYYDRLWEVFYPASSPHKIDEVYQGLIQAIFNTEVLGLDMVDVFIQTKGRERIKILINLLNQHPYTKFRGIAFGSLNGIYAQFMIPKNSFPLLKQLFAKLKEMKVIDEAEFFIGTTCDYTFTRPNLNSWDNEAGNWRFNWKKWSEEYLDFIKNKPLPKTKNYTRKLIKVDYLDIRLLKVLQSDVRKKNVDVLACLLAEDFSLLIARKQLGLVKVGSKDEIIYTILTETLNLTPILENIVITNADSVGEIIAPSVVSDIIKKNALKYRKQEQKSPENTSKSVLEKHAYLWELAEELYPPQRISERITRLKRECIIGYRVHLPDNVLDIYHTLIFRANCSEISAKRFEGLLNYIPKDSPTLPFDSQYRVIENGFLWMLRCPPSHFNEAYELLWRMNIDDFDVITIDYSSTVRYSLFFDTWDYKKEKKIAETYKDAIMMFWKSDEDFMINTVIKTCEKSIQKLSN